MSATYKKRMQRKKEYIDSRIDEANIDKGIIVLLTGNGNCLLYTSPSPRDQRGSRMPSSA